jgi:hypothetical protein
MWGCTRDVKMTGCEKCEDVPWVGTHEKVRVNVGMYQGCENVVEVFIPYVVYVGVIP